MGMCATVINSLALSSALGAIGVKSHVLTAIRMEPIGEFYTKWKAIEAMERGEVAIPEKDPTATKFDEITYDEVLNRGLKVMDVTATAMCRENKLPIYVFNMDVYGNLKKVLSGENIGTYVHA